MKFYQMSFSVGNPFPYSPLYSVLLSPSPFNHSCSICAVSMQAPSEYSYFIDHHELYSHVTLDIPHATNFERKSFLINLNCLKNEK